MPIDQQLFTKIEEVLSLNGIPQNTRQIADCVRSITGQDLYHHLSDDVHIFEDPQQIIEAYREHRASHRIASFGTQTLIENPFIFIGRDTTNQRSRWWGIIYDVAAQILRIIRSEEHRSVFTMPFVISEENRFDRSPMNNDEPQQHATLHLLNLEGMNEVGALQEYTGTSFRGFTGEHVSQMETTSNFGSFYFSVEKYNEVTLDTQTQLEREGWTLIKRKINLYNGAEDTTSNPEIVIGAVAPVELGRHAIQMMNVSQYGYSACFAVEIMHEMFLLHQAEENEEPTEESLTAVTLIQQAQSAVSGIRRTITQTINSVANRRRELDGLLASVASQTRTLHDEQNQLNEMEQGAERLALQTVIELSRLPELIQNMRQIRTAEIVNEPNSMKLVMVTHPFGMRIPAGRYGHPNGTLEEDGNILYVPPVRIEINLMGSSWSESVLVRADADEQRFHPHVSAGGIACWGRAATPLAEAWGRRDWESFVRLILGWCTQFDNGDAFTYIHTIVDIRGVAPSTGWLVSEDDNIIGPVEEGVDPDEVGYDEDDVYAAH